MVTAVQTQVKMQESAFSGRGFKGDDAPVGGNFAGSEQGVKPDMGADVQDRHAWSQVATKEAALTDFVVPYAVIQTPPKFGTGEPISCIRETDNQRNL